MKINSQNKIAICFDLHDTLLNSYPAWIKAFTMVTNGDLEKSEKMIEEFKKGEWKREICSRYGYTYDEVKNIYLQNVKPIYPVKKFCEMVKKNNSVYIITNATQPRAEEDIFILGMTFEKVYTRENGIKPDKNYIKRIIKENNLSHLIMVGNEKERDVFSLPETTSIIVNENTSYEYLMNKYNNLINLYNR